MADTARVPSIAERVEWLINVVGSSAAQGRQAPRDTRFAVALYLRERLGLGLTAAERAVDELHRDPGSKAIGKQSVQLGVVADFFGAPPGYLGADLSVIKAAQEELLVRTLASADVRAATICRSAPLSGRSGTRQVSALLQMVHRVASRENLMGSERSDDANFPKPPSPGPGPWHDHRRGVLGPESPAGGVTGRSVEEVATMEPLTSDELRELCVRLLEELDLAPPLRPAELCRRLGEKRRRPIRLLPEVVLGPASVGHLACKKNYDLIAYQHDAPAAQQMHVIYHEVIHLMRGHLDGTGALICGALAGDGLDTEAGLYSDVQEWEAETGATILSELSRRPGHPRWLPRNSPTAERGLAAAFGLTDGNWK